MTREGAPIDFDNLPPLCPFCHQPLVAAPCRNCKTAFGIHVERHQNQVGRSDHAGYVNHDKMRKRAGDEPSPMTELNIRRLEDAG